MGFWSALGKMVQGKPVFELPQDTTTQQPTATPGTSPVVDPLHDAHGNKIIPQISIEHCKTHHLGTNVAVTAWIGNASGTEIELEKIEIIGHDYNLDRRLGPGRSREVTLYKGPALTNDHNDAARIHYKIIANGDYFRADYRIEYSYDSSEGTYSVETLHPENYGVRDV